MKKNKEKKIYNVVRVMYNVRQVLAYNKKLALQEAEIGEWLYQIDMPHPDFEVEVIKLGKKGR